VKKHAVLLMAALSLCGCGIVGKLDAVSSLEASRNSYQRCLAAKGEGAHCEIQRAAYQNGLMEAEKTRGMLTSWRWL
jgi:hypothetical protein